MYRMVVTDLDGTLLNNKKQVSEANVKVIQNLKDQNITFVMATGRSDVMTRAYTKQLKNVDIVIGCDGAVIRNIRTGEILCENHLRSETCHTTFEICKKYGLQYYVFAKDELVSDDPQNERFLVHQKFNQTVEEDEEIPMQIADDLNEYVNDHIIYKRIHNRLECTTNNNADCKIHYISPCNKLFEFCNKSFFSHLKSSSFVPFRLLRHIRILYYIPNRISTIIPHTTLIP